MTFFTGLAVRRRAAVSSFIKSRRSRVRVVPVEAMEPRTHLHASAWMAPGTGWEWNDQTKTLTVFDDSRIVADPGADQPTIIVSGGETDLNIDPAGQDLDVHVNSLDVKNGAKVTLLSVPGTRTESNHRVLVTKSLAIDATSQLDLRDNDLVVDYDDEAPSPLEDVRGWIGTGYNAEAWNAPGIMSSRFWTSEPDQLSPFEFGFGYAENAELPLPYGTELGGPHFAGTNVDSTAVLVRFTRIGDVTLDDLTDFQDLSIFNGNYDSGATTNRYWVEGDFNHDGFLEFQDFSLFSGNYDPNRVRAQAPPVLGADGSSQVSVVEGGVATMTGTYADLNGNNVTFTASHGTITPASGPSYGTWTLTYAPTGAPGQSTPVTITARDGNPDTNWKTTWTIDVTVLPAAPATVTPAATGTDVTLSWSASPNATSYNVYRVVGTGPVVGAPYPTNVTGTTFADPDLDEGTTYTYAVSAVGGGVEGPMSAVVSADTIAAPASGLWVGGYRYGELGLSWDDNSMNETSTLIERSPDGTSSWTTVATVGPDESTYLEGALSPDTTYHYRVTVQNATGSSTAKVSSGRTLPARPTQPTGLRLTKVSPTEMRVEWNDIATNEDGFVIERVPMTPDASEVGPWEVVGTTGSNSTSFLDTSVRSGRWYGYRAFAQNVSGRSAQSNWEYGVTDLPMPTNVAVSDVITQQPASGGYPTSAFEVTWNYPDGVADGFYIERRHDFSGGWTRSGGTPIPANARSWPVSSVYSEMEFRVVAWTEHNQPHLHYRYESLPSSAVTSVAPTSNPPVAPSIRIDVPAGQLWEYTGGASHLILNEGDRPALTLTRPSPLDSSLTVELAAHGSGVSGDNLTVASTVTFDPGEATVPLPFDWLDDLDWDPDNRLAIVAPLQTAVLSGALLFTKVKDADPEVEIVLDGTRDLAGGGDRTIDATDPVATMLRIGR